MKTATASLQMQHFDLFNDGGIYIDCNRLYFAYFGKVPSVKSMGQMNNKKLKEWLLTEWKDKIVKKHSKQHFSRKKQKLMYEDGFFLLDNNILLNLESEIVRVLHDDTQDEIAAALIMSFKKFRTRERKTQNFSLIINSTHGLTTASLKINKPVLELSKNYNDDLLPLHNKMVTTLRQQNKSGLYLFHGIPGTGKSTYIRYLIRCINKKVIFMPPGLACNLDTPDIVHLLMNNSNTIFVIEDAEDLLLSREKNTNSSISMLLNLTDGLLGESLGIQIIATFNTNVNNIDKALLRKGRLIAMYEFKALTADKSTELLKELKAPTQLGNKPMTLAEIYNTDQEAADYNNHSRPQIGFISRAV